MRKVIDATIKDSKDMKAFLDHFHLGGDGVVIKPNWTSGDYGFYTDVESLEPLLDAVEGKKYIIESYMYGRTDNSIKIDAANALENWEWLREQDQKFLEQSGIGKLLQKYDAEYINITEEWWSGRAVDAGPIKDVVESRYKAISHQELYGMVPKKVFELRNLPLISYTKIKYTSPSVSNFSSLSMKNLFGLIPVPNREHYHGSDMETGLSRSIVDIMTIYKALFRVVGVCEGIYHIPLAREEGKNPYKMLWMEYDLIENLGIIMGSEDLVTLDAYVNSLVGLDNDKRSILRIGEEVFGRWDRDELKYITADRRAAFR